MSKFLPMLSFLSHYLALEILLMGCEQAVEAPAEQADTTTSDLEPASQQQSSTAQTELKSGNMFYMVRDVRRLAAQGRQLCGTVKTDPDRTANGGRSQRYPATAVHCDPASTATQQVLIRCWATELEKSGN